LRFPGFTDEWEKTSLGEIGETLIGLTYSPKDVVENGGTIVFRSSNIQNGMIDYSDLVRVNKSIKERIITKENDILVCARNGSTRLIGKNTLLKKSDSGNTFGAFMMIYRSEDNDIVHPILSTRRYFSQVSENLGARINQITTSDLNSFEFNLPNNPEEKRKIGKLFQLINERIATQNKIIEDLKKLKSAISVKLLSGNFTTCNIEDWRITTLGDITENFNRRNKDSVSYPMYSVTNALGFSPQNEVFDGKEIKDEDISIYKIIYKGEFAYNPARINVGSIGRYDNDTPCMISSLYICIRPTADIDSDWLFHVLKSDRMIYQYGLFGEGGVRIYLFYPNFSRIKVLVPPIGIQKEISSVLTLLGQKLHQEIKMLNEYQRQKKHLLSRMFI